MKRLFAILGIIILSLTVASPVLARENFEIPNPLEHESIEELLNAIVDFIFYVALVVAPIMIIIGGFLFITSRGDPEQVSQAKKLIIYALVGLAIIYMSKILIGLIRQVLGAS